MLITLNRGTPEQKKAMWYLGLGFDLHVKHLTRIVFLYAQHKAKIFMNLTMLNKIYTRSIQPYLHYACSVWENCLECNKYFVLRLQKRMV